MRALVSRNVSLSQMPDAFLGQHSYTPLPTFSAMQHRINSLNASLSIAVDPSLEAEYVLNIINNHRNSSKLVDIEEVN